MSPRLQFERLKLPSKSVTVPFVVPFTKTLTPISGKPSVALVIVPVHVAPKAGAVKSTNINNKTFFILYPQYSQFKFKPPKRGGRGLENHKQK